MRRRALLRTTAATTALGALAGCLDSLSGDGTDTETTTNDTETTTTETTTQSTTTSQPALEVSNKQLETTNTACGKENEGSIEFTDTGATITGSIQSNTPCYEATYVGHRILGDVVQVTIGTKEADAENCQSCIGHVEYQGTVETNRAPHSLVLVHEYTPEGDEEPTTVVVADETNSN